MTMPVENARPASETTFSVRPEQVHRDHGEEQRNRDRRADHQQRTRPAQEVPEPSDCEQDADREAFLDEADRATDVDAGIPGEVGVQLFLGQRPGIELGDRFLDAIDDLDRVRVGGALRSDVIGRHAAAIREPPRLDMVGADVCDVAQVERTIVAPADDQVAEVRHRLATRDAHGELAAPHIGKSRRYVTGRDDCLRQALRRETERSEPVRVEAHLHLAWPAALEVDPRHARNARQPGLDDLLHQLLVLDGDVRHRMTRDRAHQQRSGILGLEIVAAKDLRLVCVRRQRRQGVQARHHVQHDARHVGAHLERQLHTAAATIGFRAHLGEPGQPAHGLLDRLDQRLFEFGRRRLAPVRFDEQLWLPGVREQLDRQAQHGQHAEQHDDGGGGGHGRRVLQATFGDFHRPHPTDVPSRLAAPREFWAAPRPNARGIRRPVPRTRRNVAVLRE